MTFQFYVINLISMYICYEIIFYLIMDYFVEKYNTFFIIKYIDIALDVFKS